jgi:hypothetical protein
MIWAAFGVFYAFAAGYLLTPTIRGYNARISAAGVELVGFIEAEFVPWSQIGGLRTIGVHRGTMVRFEVDGRSRFDRLMAGYSIPVYNTDTDTDIETVLATVARFRPDLVSLSATGRHVASGNAN